jgi:hypothetical protein
MAKFIMKKYRETLPILEPLSANKTKIENQKRTSVFYLLLSLALIASSIRVLASK